MNSLHSSDANKRRRLEALCDGAVPDRPAVAFWRHSGVGIGARELARDTVQFYRRYDPDFAKVMPDIPFTMPPASVSEPRHWDYVQPAGPDRSPAAAEYVAAVAETRRRLGPEAPLLVTLFTPLMYALELRGLMAPQRFLDDPPPRVHRALVALTESVVRIGRAALAAGADGVYLSVWGTDVLPEAAFREYGRPYDLAVVDALRQGTFTILHVHGGQGLNLTWVADYPVTVVSWSTWASGISLEEGVHLLPGKVPMGGVAEGGPAVDEGGGAELTRQAEAALQWAQEQGRPLLLAPGCSLPDAVSDTVLDRLRKAVDRPAP